ncbi:ppaX [Symbiodinium natans]|uniref:PpaX protein n=1 Tax=Symbiodinium natans TaxID=878477 RepID=A0A812PZH7_9DINO|nr:ppaX [Symbiodinium natans]
MAEIDAILFDLDDTLYPVSTGFSDHRNGEVVCKFMMDYLGFDSMQSAKTLRDEYFQRYHSTMKGLNMATKDGRLPKPFRQEELGQFWADHCDFERFIHPDPRQAEVIHSLAQVGLKVAIFTNSPRKYALCCLDKLGLRALFPDDHIFAVEDVLPACKPQPEAFKQVLDSIGALPQKTVMFEDSMKNIRACKALGIRTVLVDEFKEQNQKAQSEATVTAMTAGEAALLHDIPQHADPAVDVVIKDLLEARAAMPKLWQKRFEVVAKSAP